MRVHMCRQREAGEGLEQCLEDIAVRCCRDLSGQRATWSRATGTNHQQLLGGHLHTRTHTRTRTQDQAPRSAQERDIPRRGEGVREKIKEKARRRREEERRRREEERGGTLRLRGHEELSPPASAPSTAAVSRSPAGLNYSCSASRGSARHNFAF